MLLATSVLVGHAATATPGLTAAGFSYPLDGIVDLTTFAARTLSGGCWLAGLPGFPRYNGRHVHAGIDLRASLGDIVYAVGPGVVDPASDVPHRGYGPGWSAGSVLIIRTVFPGGGGYLTVYGHTQQHLVRGGEAVKAGQPIAQVGPWNEDEGGPHLHLTVRVGELPAQGWGTPTFGEVGSRPGAEAATEPAAVVRLGYRDPRWLLSGLVDREMLVGRMADQGRDARLVARYQMAFQSVPEASAPGGCVVINAVGLPCALNDGDSAFARARAGGVVQFFETEGGERSALMAADGGAAAFQVSGALGGAYWRRGGPERFGYPLGEQELREGRIRQCFARAVLLVEEDGSVMIVPNR